jgi:hypothetical protein
MKNAEVLQLEMQSLRSKNETFFEKNEPSIFKLIKNKKFSYSDLKILISPEKETLELDIIEKGHPRYFGEGIRYCKAESEKFLNQMQPGAKLPKFNASDSSIFSFERVGSEHFRKLVKELDDSVETTNEMHMPDFLPLLVIMGTGLGFHIEDIIEKREISSLIIYEHDLDRFLVSLYTLDWQKIYSRFNVNEGCSIQLILAMEDNYISQYGYLWNELVQYTPHFPFTSLFYNHLSDTTSAKIIKDIQSNVVTFLQQWGHYDDEINQYNNARQNLIHGAKGFKPSTFRVNKNIPVAIIGAGPSLDDKIETIKANREKLLIISCGTSIGTLCKHNIKPDFHVELESDYVVYEAITKSTTKEFRKDITLLAAAQINPLCLSLFEKSCVYFKDSTALSELFIDNPQDIITSTTPTCTNAGCAIAVQLGFKNIFLFGTDFGFSSKEKHHASGSIYYQDPDKISSILSNANDFSNKETMTTTGVNGHPIETKPLYYTAQKRLEECIKYAHKKNITVYNCSDGASIKNSKWISTKKLNKVLNNLVVLATPADLPNELYKNSTIISPGEIDKKSKYLIEVVNSIFDTLINKNIKEKNLFNASKNIFVKNNIISRHVRNKFGYIQFFLRGQIWLYLAVYYNFCLKSKSNKDVEKTIIICEKWLIENRKIILNEMKEVMFHNMSIKDDPWSNQTVENRNNIK